jgi:glycerol-3-phosphate acyltransferase PlsY
VGALDGLAPLDLGVGMPDLGLPLSLGLLALGWIVGSFPSAVVVGRLVGVDPRREGDGNPGSANVWKLAGPVAGVAVFALDLSKVILPGVVGWQVGGFWGAWCGAMGGVLGAMRPVIPGMPGGRAVNAGAGAALVLHPAAGAVAIALFAGAWLLTRRRIVAIAVGFTAYPLAALLLSVRSLEDAWLLAGIGTLYLVLVGRYVATAGRSRPGGGPQSREDGPKHRAASDAEALPRT